MCLSSIRAAKPDELIIWDNGSTHAFRAMLREFAPDVLIESYNVGLDMAKHNLIELTRGDVFCYSDDDVLHEVGWLEKQLQILETYPNVGTVSGSPQRVHFRWGISSNLKLAQEYKMKIERGQIIPEWMEKEYAASVGIQDVNLWYARTVSETDTLLEYKGVKAFAHGHHFQFICYPERVKKFFKPSYQYMQNERGRDEAIDAAGFMRLTTRERTVKHLGNRL
jgi:glycosyltransferase involved in cell wall biosynthesis